MDDRSIILCPGDNTQVSPLDGKTVNYDKLEIGVFFAELNHPSGGI